MEDEPTVQFKVTLDKQFGSSRKRQSDVSFRSLLLAGIDSIFQPMKMSSEPKITRTIGSHPVVQEDTVSSTSKVNVTFNGLTGFGKQPKQPKISCSVSSPENIFSSNFSHFNRAQRRKRVNLKLSDLDWERKT